MPNSKHDRPYSWPGNKNGVLPPSTHEQALHEIHGTFEGWRMYEGHSGGWFVNGKLYGDTKGRFDDGDNIYTSCIISGPDVDGIVVTENSVYRLVPFNLGAHNAQLKQR